MLFQTFHLTVLCHNVLVWNSPEKYGNCVVMKAGHELKYWAISRLKHLLQIHTGI